MDFHRIFRPFEPGIECHGKGFARKIDATDSCRHRQQKRTHRTGPIGKGVDGGKKINGIKRHLAVDSNGFPLTIVISRANVHDSKCAIGLAIDTVCKYPTIRLLKADNGYRGPLVKNLKEGLNV